MKLQILALTLIAATPPLCAQTAPANWTTKTSLTSQTFVPPALQTGEIYSVTVYDSASLDGQTVRSRAFCFSAPRPMARGNNTDPAACDYCVYGHDAAGKAVIVLSTEVAN